MDHEPRIPSDDHAGDVLGPVDPDPAPDPEVDPSLNVPDDIAALLAPEADPA